MGIEEELPENWGVIDLNESSEPPDLIKFLLGGEQQIRAENAKLRREVERLKRGRWAARAKAKKWWRRFRARGRIIEQMQQRKRRDG